MTTNTRRRVLGETGLLHPRPEAVTAPLFGGHGSFFLVLDKVQVKYEMLRAHVVDGLRVRPISSCWITDLSEHEADRGEAEENEGAEVEIVPVLGQSAATVQPGDRSFHDPSLGQDDEALGGVGAFDDFGFEVRQYRCERVMKFRPLVAVVAEQLLQEWEHSEQRRQHRDAAIAILNVRRCDQRV